MTQQYAEWLTAIVNTRLLFNTTEECEAFLDSGSIRSNGILRACAIERPFEKYEYDFTQSLYAITPTHLYVFYEAKDIFFKVPRTAADGLEQTRLDDNVGILTMNGKHYLAFDEIMLYIPINKKNLQKYKIEKVEWIE